MKIAQIAPLWERVSPRGTSDPERALYYLIEELVRRGHDVTLCASADSRTSGNLKALCATPFSRASSGWNQAAARIQAIEQGFEKCAEKFDIIHSHVGIDGLPMAWRNATPTVTTIQHRLDVPEYVPVFKQFRNLPLVSTSNLQRRPLAWASWQQTIYPGVPSDLYRFNSRPGTYLAFVGSLFVNQGLGQAIELARRAQLPLRVASRQRGASAPPLSIPTELLIADQGIEWLGELREEEKNDFLGKALAFVCTSDGGDPSSLCVAESLACGTPVVAFHEGHAAEMIYDHVTGFACETIDEMVDVMPLVGDLDRRECRAAFEKRFSAERMTDQYLRLYERLSNVASTPRVSAASSTLSVQTIPRPITISR